VGLGIALTCADAPEARQAMLTDPRLRSPFLDMELPPWRDDGDLRIFLARLVQSLPLRRPSPVDSPGLRRLIATRSSGLTWTICKAFERAAVTAIASGKERLDRSSLERQAVWRRLIAPLASLPASLPDQNAAWGSRQHLPRRVGGACCADFPVLSCFPDRD